MSNERDELAWEIFRADNAAVPDDALRQDFPQEAEYALHIAEGLLEAGFRKPRTITTAEELDKLGFQAVVLDAYGTPYVCERHRTDGSRNEWKPAGVDHLDDSEAILYHGPATVVHEGEAAK